MAGLDSLLTTALTRRLDTLLSALGAPAGGVRGAPIDTATPAAAAAIGESASASAALTPHTSSSTPDSTSADQPAPQRQPPATLSAAARTIDMLLQLAPDTPGAVHGTTPLWPLPPGDARHAFAPVFAAALQNNVDSSGLFYESHLAQWAAGSRSLEQLLQDPQARWPRDSFLPAAQTAGAPPADSIGTASTHVPAQPAGAPPAALLAPDSVTLVRQQLETLIAPQFHWSGEAWPGAALDWTVEERREHASPGEPMTSGAWQTRLRLSLAALGAVDVDLSLTGHQLQVQVKAAAPATVSLIASGRDELRQRFAAAGLMAGPVRVSLLDDTAPDAANDTAPGITP